MKLTISALLVALLFTACATKRQPPVALGPIAPQKNATLIAGRSGAYVALKPNGTLTLELQSNASAGYHWKLAKPLDPNVLQIVPSGAAQPPPIALPPATVTTAPQPEKWVFNAVGPGTAKVRMIYSRPNQPLNDAATYDFTVNAE